jgi:hypothetical protein
MWFHDRSADTEDAGARKGGGKGSKINPEEKVGEDTTEAATARRWSGSVFFQHQTAVGAIACRARDASVQAEGIQHARCEYELTISLRGTLKTMQKAKHEGRNEDALSAHHGSSRRNKRAEGLFRLD